MSDSINVQGEKPIVKDLSIEIHFHDKRGTHSLHLWRPDPKSHRLEVEVAKRAKIQKAPAPIPEKVIRNVFHRASVAPKIIEQWRRGDRRDWNAIADAARQEHVEGSSTGVAT